MPIIKLIKTAEEIRDTLIKYPGRVSEAVIASAIARYEQLQEEYDIESPAVSMNIRENSFALSLREQRELKLRTAAAVFLKWVGLYPTAEEFERVVDDCGNLSLYRGISDLPVYSLALLGYRNRTAEASKLKEQFVLSEQDIQHLGDLIYAEKLKILEHGRKIARKTNALVSGDEPELEEHRKYATNKIIMRACNMHNAKISKEYLHAIENLALQTDKKKKLIYDVVSMQAASNHPTVVDAYISSFGKTREQAAPEPKPITRLLKIGAYRRMNTGENAPEAKEKLVNGVSEDAKVPKCYIENLLKPLEPLTRNECEFIGYGYYLFKDLNRQSGYVIIKKAIDRLAHKRRETREERFVQNANRAIETAQIFA